MKNVTTNFQAKDTQSLYICEMYKGCKKLEVYWYVLTYIRFVCMVWKSKGEDNQNFNTQTQNQPQFSLTVLLLLFTRDRFSNIAVLVQL